MCPVKPPRGIAPPSTTPTTQAAEDVDLNVDELTQGGASGRLALSTRPRSTRSSSAPKSASSILAATGQSANAPADQAAAGGATAGDLLFGGRSPGTRQPFDVGAP